VEGDITTGSFAMLEATSNLKEDMRASSCTKTTQENGCRTVA
jgi:hypothetical protein